MLIFRSMKVLRAWLLVVLAVVLPLRGALAAAMLCPVSEFGTQTEVPLHDHSSTHVAFDGASDHSHPGTHEDPSGSAHHEHGGGVLDKCSACSAFCSVTPLTGGGSALFQPHKPAADLFDALPAPAAGYLSGGQERPPRSI